MALAARISKFFKPFDEEGLVLSTQKSVRESNLSESETSLRCILCHTRIRGETKKRRYNVSGASTVQVTPDPIPNSEVKLQRADDSWTQLGPAKVSQCRFMQMPPHKGGFCFWD